MRTHLLPCLLCLLILGAHGARADEMAQVDMLRRVFSRPIPEWRDVLRQHSHVLDSSFFTNVEERIHWSVEHNHIDDAIRFAFVADYAADVKGQHGGYRLGLAEAFLRAGNLGMGGQLIDAILLDEKDKDNKPALFIKAALLEAQKSFFEAHEAYGKLADQGYQAAECAYRMGRISLLISEEPRGRAEFERALKLNPNHELARKELDRILARYKHDTTAGPATTDQKNRAQQFFQEAEAAVTAGQLQQAEGFYLKAIEADPGHLKALVYLGALYYRMGNIDQAVRYLVQATRADANDFEAWRYLGNSYERKFDTQGNRGDLNEAISAYQQGIRINPEDRLIQGELERALQKQEPSAHNP